MCIKCIITPIIFLVIVALGFFFIWGNVFAAVPLEAIGTRDPAEFTAAIAGRTSGQEMFQAFILLLASMAFGGIGFFFYQRIKKLRA